MYNLEPNAEPIPTSFWGKDHWNLLVYFETLMVDMSNKPWSTARPWGNISLCRMRCAPHHWRDFSPKHENQYHPMSREDYPTRLRHGELKPFYDDWDCTGDLIAAELIEVRKKDEPYRPFQNNKKGWYVQVRLTDLGYFLAAMIRKHLGKGGKYAEFGINAEDLIRFKEEIERNRTPLTAKMRYAMKREAMEREAKAVKRG